MLNYIKTIAGKHWILPYILIPLFRHHEYICVSFILVLAILFVCPRVFFPSFFPGKGFSSSVLYPHFYAMPYVLTDAMLSMQLHSRRWAQKKYIFVTPRFPAQEIYIVDNETSINKIGNRRKSEIIKKPMDGKKSLIMFTTPKKMFK